MVVIMTNEKLQSDFNAGTTILGVPGNELKFISEITGDAIVHSAEIILSVPDPENRKIRRSRFLPGIHNENPEGFEQIVALLERQTLISTDIGSEARSLQARLESLIEKPRKWSSYISGENLIDRDKVIENHELQTHMIFVMYEIYGPGGAIANYLERLGAESRVGPVAVSVEKRPQKNRSLWDDTWHLGYIRGGKSEKIISELINAAEHGAISVDLEQFASQEIERLTDITNRLKLLKLRAEISAS